MMDHYLEQEEEERQHPSGIPAVLVHHDRQHQNHPAYDDINIDVGNSRPGSDYRHPVGSPLTASPSPRRTSTNTNPNNSSKMATTKKRNSKKSNSHDWEQYLITWLERFHRWRYQQERQKRRRGKKKNPSSDASYQLGDDEDGDEEDDDDNRSNLSNGSNISAWIMERLQILRSGVDKKALWTAGAWTLMVLVGYRNGTIGNRRAKRIEPSPPPASSSAPPAAAAAAPPPPPPSHRSATEAPLSSLYRAAREGKIEKAMLGPSGSVFYLLSDGADGTGDRNRLVWKRSYVPPQLSSRDLIETLTSTCPNVSALPESLIGRLGTPVLAALPFAYLYFLYRMLQSTMGGGDIAKSLKSKSSTTFVDVAGLDNVLTDVSEIVSYLQNPSKFIPIGAKPPRAVLLYGPPGAGKTLMAQAVAGQANVDCFLACSASDFVEVYVGRGAARVRSLFAQAKQQAKQRFRERRRVKSKLWQWFFGGGTEDDDDYAASTDRRHDKPCAILFIDELDALGKTRSSSTLTSNDEREQTLNQLLIELDGFGSGCGGYHRNATVYDTSATSTAALGQQYRATADDDDDIDDDDVTLIVMAASNRVDVLDPALLRRFDRQIFIGYPDAKGRTEILKLHARRVACDPAVDFARLSSEARTGGCSGAELRNLVNDAALLAVRDGSTVVRQTHLEHAARRLQQMKTNHQNQSTGRGPLYQRSQYTQGPLGIH